MNDPDLGTIARVDPRSVWGSEPHEFTPWLRENIDLLGKALGLEIDAGVQQEVAVGLFSADLLGTDVAIERRDLGREPARSDRSRPSREAAHLRGWA